MPYEYELSSRRKVLLYLYQVCPVIDIINNIYNIKRSIENKEIVDWYIDIYPFKAPDNLTYMTWFIREFNIFSKLSDKGIEGIQNDHRTIFKRLGWMYLNT